MQLVMRPGFLLSSCAVCARRSQGLACFYRHDAGLSILILPGARLNNFSTRRMQCIVGSQYAVYTAAIFGVVQNYAR